ELATTFLKEKGFEILHKNWRYKKAEIDIIGQLKDTLVFVEVKCRKSEFFGRPEQAINHKKESLYKLTAEHYLEVNDLEYEVRFDVISIIHNNNKTEIEHFISAF
ncbi:MAG: YraN family protein, partial [Flavobacteriales bacterium]|nr:YraN family protein [Flavobacteriales bacterium]